MRQDDFTTILEAYRTGCASDFLQGKYASGWTDYWTVPPCSPEALSRAGRQFTFSRAQSLRHYRRAILQGSQSRQVMICTLLPSREQKIYCLESLHPIKASRFLGDAAFEALAEAFVPTRINL